MTPTGPETLALARPEEPEPREWSRAEVDLGPSMGHSAGEVVRIDRGDSTYALYCIADGDFALTDGLCTHASTHLADGYLEGCVIECPKHNGRFDVRTGEPMRRPATVPLRSYPVRVVQGRIIAEIPDDDPVGSTEVGL